MSGVSVRLKKELSSLATNPPEGVSCHLQEGSTTKMDATITGPKASPYEDGQFRLEIVLPSRYPFVPPSVRFLTPIYHPNVDEGGRICLDLLKMPPVGGWRCTVTVATVLNSIAGLMSAPNPDDPLVVDIADLYKRNRAKFEAEARRWTKLHCRAQEECNRDEEEVPGAKRLKIEGLESE